MGGAYAPAACVRGDRDLSLLSERDYNALQVGMTPAQVLAIMGKPTKTEERKSHANTHEYWSWSRGLQYVGVEFVNGRLDQKHVDY